MLPTEPAPGHLVVYKQQPARVESAEGDKLALKLADGGSKRVRPKDVTVLHPGPVASLGGLDAGEGELEDAWEALVGEPFTLADLAELAFGEYTPATAWSAWRAVADGLLFEGTPEALSARDPEAVTAERERREARARAEAERAALLERLAEGRMAPEDAGALSEVERVALGRAQASPILRELGLEESQEEAHRLLLTVGYWDLLGDPYPVRYGAPTDSAAEPVPALPEGERADLTHLSAFAIDDMANADPDDAISVDGDRVWVHVADAAAVAAPESDLDRTARSRGATLYLPHDVRTMLPHEAVARLGLGLAETSPALSIGFRVTEDGELADIAVTPSWIRAQRLTYAAADSCLEEEPLATLASAAERFRRARTANGAVAFQLPEVAVSVVDGEVVIRALDDSASRRLVAECMVMAGHAAARLAEAEGITLPFAGQPAPEGAAEGEGLVWAYAMRKLMRPSRVDLSPAPHAGLGLSAYTYATSPLRRYYDLVVHQQLRAHVTGGEPADRAALEERIAGLSERMRALRQTERASNQHHKLVYLRRLGEWRGEGVVVERQGPRGRVLVPALAMEATVSLPGSVEPGATVTLRLTSVDLPTQRANFRVEES